MTIKDKILEHIQKNKKLDKKMLVEIKEKTVDCNEFKKMLLENNLIDEEGFLLFLSKELKIPFLDLRKYKISLKNQELLAQEIAIKYKVVPICKIGNALTIATANPLDVLVYDDIKIITGVDKIALVLSREEDIAKGLDYLYKSVEDFSKSFDETNTLDIEEINKDKEGSQDLENLITESKHPPIVRAIDLIIYNALKKRASDIHIEPYEDKLLVKYRVDGTGSWNTIGGTINNVPLTGTDEIKSHELVLPGDMRGKFLQLQFTHSSAVDGFDIYCINLKYDIEEFNG